MFQEEINSDVFVEGISNDSRKVKANWIYVSETNNHAYEQEARQKGAFPIRNQKQVDYMTVLNELENDVCKGMQVIGITGTNGKSSVARLLWKLFQEENIKTMCIGTGYIQILDQVQQSANTTPDLFALWNAFQEAKAKDVKMVIMEVSSHAIVLNRIAFLTFTMIIYTNITSDHMDFHKTSVHYRYTKYKLRQYLKPEGVILVNNDFSYAKELQSLTKHKMITVGSKNAHDTLEKVIMDLHGSRFLCHGHWFQTPLLAMANVYNCLQVLAVGRYFHFSYETIQNVFQKQKAIEGRMQIVYEKEITIMIDYAHTYEAVQQLLQFFYPQREKLWIIIGCGGEREVKKRYEIGELCANISPHCIFTSDNPRNEPLQNILLDMKKNAVGSVLCIENRKFAIKHAITHAKKSDIIVIVGKGNETTQTIKGKTIPFNDAQIALHLLKEEDISWK